MRAYYINLDRRPDRRAAMEARFLALAMDFVRVQGLIPDDATVEQRRRYCNPLAYRWRTEGELACSISHLAAMQAFLDSGAAFAAVFEDDVMLSPSLDEFLRDFELAGLPIDLLRLETDCASQRRKPRRDQQFGVYSICRMFSTGRGTAGYVVSRRAAERIIAGEEVLFSLTDQALFNPYERLAQELTMRQLDPALVMQEIIPGDTDKGTGVSDLEALRLARIRDNGRTLRRLPHNIIDFLDRDIRVAAIKAWHLYVGGAAKRVIPFKPD